MQYQDVRELLKERIDKIRSENTVDGYLPLRDKLRIQELQYAMSLIDKVIIESNQMMIGHWYYLIKNSTGRAMPEMVYARLVSKPKKEGKTSVHYVFTLNSDKKIMHLTKDDLFKFGYVKSNTTVTPIFSEKDLAEEYLAECIEKYEKKLLRLKEKREEKLAKEKAKMKPKRRIIKRRAPKV